VKGFGKKGDGLFHAEHAERVVKVLEGGNAPVGKNGGESDGDVETSGKLANDTLRRLKNVPVSELHGVRT
jgi:hypothetical protein